MKNIFVRPHLPCPAKIQTFIYAVNIPIPNISNASFIKMTKYKALPDLELIDLIKVDDHTAFNELFSRYKTILFLFAHRRLDDKEQAKDILHDTFADLWTKRETVKMINVQAFLFTVVKNKILDLVKHSKVSEKYIDNLRHVYEQATPEPADYRLRYNNLSELIDKEIAALPDIYRLPFELNRKQHMSSKEIAEELNISEEALRSRLRRASDLLKGRLGLSMILIMHYTIFRN